MHLPGIKDVEKAEYFRTEGEKLVADSQTEADHIYGAGIYR